MAARSGAGGFPLAATALMFVALTQAMSTSASWTGGPEGSANHGRRGATHPPVAGQWWHQLSQLKPPTPSWVQWHHDPGAVPGPAMSGSRPYATDWHSAEMASTCLLAWCPLPGNPGSPPLFPLPAVVAGALRRLNPQVTPVSPDASSSGWLDPIDIRRFLWRQHGCACWAGTHTPLPVVVAWGERHRRPGQ